MTDSMNSIDLFGAWRIWMSGELDHMLILWGFPLYWWARVGKILQFIGALTVIAEIIGAERLRAFGYSMHGVVTWASIKRQYREVSQLMRHTFAIIFKHPNDDSASIAVSGLLLIAGSCCSWRWRSAVSAPSWFG